MTQWPVISSDFSAYRENPELCAVEIPVGTCSADTIVVFGQDGYLFVHTGANNINGQYLMPQDEAQALAAQWAETLDRRRETSKAAGVQFLQMIVPEKSSLLPQKTPFPAAAGTPLMQALSASQASHPDYIDVRVLFDADEALIAFPKANGHMSAFGSVKAFQAALARLGLEPPTITFGPPQIKRSDLSNHFGGLQFYNRVAFPNSPEIETYSAGLQEILVIEDAGHRGQRRGWSNPSAPIKKRVLAFGNSFFERGGSPECLSWWFARWFEEFQFIWSPDLDPAEIEAYKPDIVICQTIERFLPQVQGR